MSSMKLEQVRDWHIEEVRRMNNSQHPFPNNSTVLQALAEHHRAMADAIDAHFAGMCEPVATILGSDPFDDDMRKGFYTSAASMERLASLPAGTKLYTAPHIDLAAVREVIAELDCATGDASDMGEWAQGLRDKLEAAIKGVA